MSSVNKEGTDSLTVAAVARRIGVAPATLRTWDRRYGLGPSSHTAGDHRVYSHEDLLRLTYMRQMVISGHSASIAAERAVSATPKDLEKFCGHARNRFSSPMAGGDDELKRDLELANELFHYAEVLDEKSFCEIIDREIGARGVERVWSNLCVPLLNRVGTLWEESGSGIAIEHFVTEGLSLSLRRAVKEIEKPVNDRPVFIACVEGDYHTLPLKALIAALSIYDVRCVSLGAQLPSETLAETLIKTAPPVIFLWSQMPQDKKQMKKVLSMLPNFRVKPRVVIGGPGWQDYERAGFEIDQNLRHSGSLAQTVRYITEVFLGG